MPQLIHQLKFSGPLLALTLLLALFFPTLGSRWFRKGERAVGRLAQRPVRALLLVGLLSLLLNVSLGLFAGIPAPCVHDEFSYLLAADTFAHGRLANPTPPLWKHFESFQIFFQPTYASKYPPGQGVTLAFGQALFGLPIVGVWLTSALACMAVCWMLYQWVTPRWALIGGLLAVAHPTVTDWSQRYWGGALAMLGGALLLGGIKRLFQAITRETQGEKREVGAGLAIGVGIAILANSRPYEGLVFTVGCLAALAWMRIRHSKVRVSRLLTAALPMWLALVPTAAWMGYYNWRVTGNPLTLPYILHEAIYVVAPSFLWQPPRAVPAYHHPLMRAFYLYQDAPVYWGARTRAGFLSTAQRLLITVLGGFYRPVALALPLVTLPWWLRRAPWARMAFGIALLTLLSLLVEKSHRPHYAAPSVGLVFLSIVAGLRALRAWRWRGRPTGRFLARGVLLVSLFALVNSYVRMTRPGPVSWCERRVRIERQLNRAPGKYLIVVRYRPNHILDQEWVYNRADIESAKVIWARDMGESQNRELLDYYRDRHILRLDADARPPRLTPYAAR